MQLEETIQRLEVLIEDARRELQASKVEQYTDICQHRLTTLEAAQESLVKLKSSTVFLENTLLWLRS